MYIWLSSSNENRLTTTIQNKSKNNKSIRIPCRYQSIQLEVLIRFVCSFEIHVQCKSGGRRAVCHLSRKKYKTTTKINIRFVAGTMLECKMYLEDRCNWIRQIFRIALLKILITKLEYIGVCGNSNYLFGDYLSGPKLIAVLTTLKRKETLGYSVPQYCILGFTPSTIFFKSTLINCTH